MWHQWARGESHDARVKVIVVAALPGVGLLPPLTVSQDIFPSQN